jgi:neutral amino acid transport system permease protein
VTAVEVRPSTDVDPGATAATAPGRVLWALAAGTLAVTVLLVAYTIASADDEGGATALTFVLASVAAGLGVVIVFEATRQFQLATLDDRSRAAPRAALAALMALAVYGVVFVGFDRIRAAFDDKAAKAAAGALEPITSGWATFWGVVVGLLLFLLPTLVTLLVQRSPDTAGFAGRVFLGMTAASLAAGVTGLLIAYGGDWVHSLLDQVANRIAAGVLTGSILAVAGLGLSLVFGVLHLVNFAHAQFLVIGAYVALFFNEQLGLSIWLAVLPAVAVGVGLGILSESALWRPMRRRQVTGPTLLILSIGFGLLLQYLVLYTSRGDTSSYDIPRETRVSLFGWDKVRLTPTEWILIGVSLVLVVGVALLLTATTLGKAVRAAADSTELAEISGIDVNRVIMAIWIIAGGLAAYGGVAASLQFNVVTPLLGLRFILPIFAAVIVGGLGTAYGALAGGLLVGLAQEVSPVLPFVSTSYQELVGFVILVGVLLLRPQGILGRRERV